MEQKPLPKFVGIFYQPSLLVLGAATILAFITLALKPSDWNVKDWQNLVWISWGILFVFILVWRSLGWYLSPAKDFQQNKDVIDLYTKITTSVLLVLSLSITWLGLRTTQKATDRNLELAQITLENNEDQQLQDRFTRALEKLGASTTYERIAGVISFKNIDSLYKSEADYFTAQSKTDSEDERQRLRFEFEQQKGKHWEIMGILTNFIQENAPWLENQEKKTDGKPRGDISMILGVIGDRKLTYQHGEEKSIVLIGTDLRNYTFRPGANFDGALFRKAHLEGATLEKVSLKGASFYYAYLDRANLRNADLTGADFTNANLAGVDLTNAIVDDRSNLSLAITDDQTKCPSGFRNDREARACMRILDPK